MRLIAVLVVTSVARYGTQWVSLPETGHAKVFGSGLERRGRRGCGTRVIYGLSGIDVDLIGLEEFQPAMEDALVANRTNGA